MSHYKMRRTNRKGFTLVELAVVVVIIAVLASFGVPRMLKMVERSKASEAFGYLAAVRSSQERYQAREGTYADTIEALDIGMTAPQYFAVTPITAAENAWSMTLERSGAASGYGKYTVTFTQDGYDSVNSTIEDTDINPRGS